MANENQARYFLRHIAQAEAQGDMISLREWKRLYENWQGSNEYVETKRELFNIGQTNVWPGQKEA